MFFAFVRKECLLLLADRGTIVTLFVMPIVFIGFFGVVFSGANGTRAHRVAMWHDAGDTRGAALAKAMDASALFRVSPVSSPQGVVRAVADRSVRIGVIVPRELAPNDGVPVRLVIDPGASPLFREPVQTALGNIAQTVLAPRDAPPVYVAAEAPPGGRALVNASAFQLAVPGNALLFSFLLAVSVALGFVQERQIGTFRRLLAAPIGRRRTLVAKLVPYYLIGLIQMVFLFGVGTLVFGMSVAGSVFALGALTAASVLCAVALGLLIASFGGSEKQVGAFASVLVLVMSLLGGAMYPRTLMPTLMQRVGLFVPQGWGLDGYYDVLVRSGTTVVDVAPHIGALVVFALVFAIVGMLRFRFD